MTIKNKLRKGLAGLLIAGAMIIPTGCSDTRTEVSEVMYDDAVVTSKRYIGEDNQMGTGIAIGIAMDDLASGIVMGAALSEDEHHYITFTGKIITSRLDNRTLHNRFNLGDPADISYREVYRSTYEAKGPEHKKELVDRKFSGYEFIDAQRTQDLGGQK